MKSEKLVFGVGINDAGYVTERRETVSRENGKRKQKLIWFCPFYRAWKDMLSRCYSSTYQDRKPTYVGCIVTDDWHTFSVFKSWMMAQDWEGNQLDKDLLSEGNKIYSPETCIFVTQMVNSFTTDCGASRGDYLIGVNWDKGRSKFKSRCSNPFTKKQESLGYFTCEQEANQAWINRKLELARELASIQTDLRVAKALIDRYSKPQ